MKSDELSFRPGFRLSVANAVMVLAVGGKEGGSGNLHKGADQWRYVNGQKTHLKAGTIVLIEAGDRHEIRNTDRTSPEDGERLRASCLSR